MTSRAGVVVTVAASLMILLSACTSEPSGAEDTVEGIVSEVTGDLSAVESFVVLDSGGNSHLFRPEPGLLFYGAPLSHLRDHVVSGQPVVVTFDVGANGQRTAVLIVHADGDDEHDHSE